MNGDYGHSEYDESARVGTPPPTYQEKTIQTTRGPRSITPSEGGEAVTLNRERMLLSFLAWNTEPYEGHNISWDVSLRDLLTGLGITLDDCREALEAP